MGQNGRMKLPNLRQRGKRWYYDHGGTPRRWEPLGSDEAVALRKYHQIHDAPKPERGTVDKMLADYLEHPRAPIKAGTLVNYRNFRRHLAAVFGHLLPHELTQGDIVRYLKKCPRKSARGEIGLLSLAFVGWIEEERLTFNPCFGVKVKLPASRRDRLLSGPEIDAILAQCDERAAVALELAYATGLRVSDLCSLRWSDVAAWKDTQKTGARQAFEQTDYLDAILVRARALQAKVASMYVLCARGGKPWTRDALWRRVKGAAARAGVEDATTHDFRAAAGTEAERIGQDPQKFLGHRRRQTTEGYLRGKRVNVVRPLDRKRG
jgi:integrase